VSVRNHAPKRRRTTPDKERSKDAAFRRPTRTLCPPYRPQGNRRARAAEASQCAGARHRRGRARRAMPHVSRRRRRRYARHRRSRHGVALEPSTPDHPRHEQHRQTEGGKRSGKPRAHQSRREDQNTWDEAHRRECARYRLALRHRRRRLRQFSDALSGQRCLPPREGHAHLGRRRPVRGPSRDLQIPICATPMDCPFPITATSSAKRRRRAASRLARRRACSVRSRVSSAR